MKTNCRICHSSDLKTFVDFGDLYMTGHFPEPDEEVNKAELALAKCQGCGLVQLRDSQRIENLYKEGYGYESHLNGSMKRHLLSAANNFERFQKLSSGDVVLDIASNDGTLLSGYKTPGLTVVGIDPLVASFSDYYPSSAVKLQSFFSKEVYFSIVRKPANVITSFSVFYDLEDPARFMQDIEATLAADGIWVLEQSYLPTMIGTLGFDTICHEHLLYLTLSDINQLCKVSGLEIFDVSLNDVNGGSFRVFIQKRKLGSRAVSPYVSFLLEQEAKLHSISNDGLYLFNEAIETFRAQLISLLSKFKEQGYRLIGLGASTKGNVLLQVCSINSEYLDCIGEINKKKFGKVTPGTKIKIVSEQEALAETIFPIAALVLPWHFRDSIAQKMSQSSGRDSRLIFPLPQTPTVVSY